MKKALFNMFLMTLLIVGFTGQSWAFGSRHHHHDGSNDPSQGSGSNISGSDQGNDPLNPDFVPPGGNGNGSGSGNPPSNNFPAAPVPEPMTLSLLGMGVAGLLMKRKLR